MAYNALKYDSPLKDMMQVVRKVVKDQRFSLEDDEYLVRSRF